MIDENSYEYLQSEHHRARKVLDNHGLSDWVVLPNERELVRRIDPKDYYANEECPKDKDNGDFMCQGCGNWFGETLTFTGYVCHWCTGALT